MSDTNQQQDQSTQDETRIDAAEGTTALPGSRLREQRENSHLSQEEAAHHLRLDVQLIKALEEDDYSRLPSPAYICGYLRSYARLLKLPEDEIVQAYSRGEQIDAALIPQSVSITPKNSINPAVIKTIVIVIIAALVAAGLYLAADKFDLFSTNHSQQTSKLSVPVVPKALEQQNKAADETAQTDGQMQEETTTAPKSQTPPSVRPVTGKTVVEELPTPKATIEAAVSPEEKPQVETATKPAVSATTSEPVQQNAPAAKLAQLRLHFNGDSWAEVTDNTGKRLLYHLVTKDSDINLSGEPPFTILLGNAPEVQVFYEGKEFDHARYHRDEIAYFHIGAK